MAAVLAGGPGALLSHTSAGALWGIIDPIPGAVHVTARGGGRQRRGIVFHRGSDLDGARTTRDRIPLTAPNPTLLDLAATLSPRRLERAIEVADRLSLLDVTELTRLCESRRGRTGTGRLHSLVARYRPMPQTRSELERRFLRLCDKAGLPKPAVNVPVEGIEVDFLWPDERVVVELDGYEFHRGRGAFERDRRRDTTLQLAGHRVLRLTDRRLADEATDAISELQTLLGVRGG